MADNFLAIFLRICLFELQETKVKETVHLYSAECFTLLIKINRKIVFKYFSFPQLRTGNVHT